MSETPCIAIAVDRQQSKASYHPIDVVYSADDAAALHPPGAQIEPPADWKGIFPGSPEALELGGPREDVLDTISSGFRLSNIDEWHLKGRGITGIHEWHPFSLPRGWYGCRGS